MAIPQPLKRVRDFEKLGFGMFIHWGLYSQMGMGEWIMCLGNIPKEEYMKLKDTFTAEEFDARSITGLAKKAGIKYIVLTTRHHDGFSLFDTCGLNDYDAPHSPAGRDLIKEFVEACRADDIVPFFYHTTLDWYQESFNNDFKAYLQYLRDSVEILCKNYGKIGGLWFDGNWSKPEEDWEEDKLYEVIRKHQPDAIIVNNTGLQARGQAGNMEIDSVTFEQGKPTFIDREGKPKYLAAEMCQTINNHWGVGMNDFAYKSSVELIETLCDCRRVGANYLLNIGPTAQGGLDKMQEALLETVGKWISVCGQSIYEAIPSGIKAKGRDFVLDLQDKSYIFVYDLSANGHDNVTVQGGGSGYRVLEKVNRPIEEIKWVDNGEKLHFTQGLEEQVLTFNATGYPYGVSTVVRVAEVSYKTV